MHQVGMSLETQHWCNTFIATEFDFSLLFHSVEGKKIMGKSCKPNLHLQINKLAYPVPSCNILIFQSHIYLIHTGLAAKFES